jgi:hypothetical protein
MTPGAGGLTGKSAGIYRSSNNGTSWTAVNTGLPDLLVLYLFGPSPSSNLYWFAVSDTVIFACTNNGYLYPRFDSIVDSIFVSKNNGENWSYFKSGLPDNLKINRLSANSTYLFAATSEGVWQEPLSEVTGINTQKPQQDVSNRDNFKIFFPSSTNQNATIEFSLLQSMPVAAKIYNLSGKEIATLVNKNLGAGEHSFSWNTKNVAAGCYTVKMQVGSNVFIKNVPVSR